MKKFWHNQTVSASILLTSSLLAVLISNSSYLSIYQNFFSTSLPLNITFLSIAKQMDFKLWVDDFLMAIFFLLIGLELKREILVGELSSKSKVVLPFFAAIGGVAFPALIYFLINANDPENLGGMAIPCATDIAFVIGVLSFFGNKISNSLRMFIIALAVIDDLIAILIIAIFYSSNVDFAYLNYAILTTLLLLCFNKLKISSLIPYLLCAPFLWLFILKSGIHPTISGVILAFLIPFRDKKNSCSPSQFLELKLYIPVTYIILPIFAFANSGVIFDNLSLRDFSSKMFIGITLGLFIGKQLGIGLMVYLLKKFKLCQLPKGSNWMEFYAVAILSGIGFTMSLFIGSLAFADQNIIEKIRVAVACGSIISGIAGCVILKIAIKLKNQNDR